MSRCLAARQSRGVGLMNACCLCPYPLLLSLKAVTPDPAMPNANPHGKRWGVRSNPTPSLTLRSAGGVARDGGPHVLPQLRAADGHQCRECLRAQPLRHIPSTRTQWVCPSVVETSANELRLPPGSDNAHCFIVLRARMASPPMREEGGCL